MAIFKHLDGSFHRYPDPKEPPPLKPVDGRPGWFTNTRTGDQIYVEPPKPAQPAQP